MKNRIHYLRLFGLNENATEDEIKKAYRKLAKKYHPDINSDPKAQQVFIDLHEAYERLLHAEFQTQVVTKKRSEQSFEFRRAQAQSRYEEQQELELKKQSYYFQKLVGGKTWSYFKLYAFFSAFFAVVVFVDYFLPSKKVKDRIVAFSSPYNGLFDGEIVALKTIQNRAVFIKDCMVTNIIENPEVLLELSPILHQPKQIWRKEDVFLEAFEVDFSLWSAFPFFCIFFLIPLFTCFYKRKSLLFILLYYLSCYGVSVVLIYILVTQNRFIHLLSLGYY